MYGWKYRNKGKTYCSSQDSRKDERGYPGWIPLSQLAFVEMKDWNRKNYAIVISNVVLMYLEEKGIDIKLIYLTTLPIEGIINEKVKVKTPQGVGLLS
ncbi:hypothetical protein [Pseudogracilibacillus sp. SO30301A]|uniref:hypothetical protein n=1 Tax=Pseudogracilibacillus sp. SO30301A TaxID=3098291 RepID=UPI00300E597E